MSLKLAMAATVAAIAMMAPVAANAAAFQGTFTVNALNADPGLVLSTAPHNGANVSGNNFSFNLTQGNSISFDLFDIWTDEGAVNSDDRVSKAISTVFNFASPPPPFGGQVNGTTVGGNVWFIFQQGSVDWNDPVDVTFGALNDGLLRIWLSDEEFNTGLFGLVPGQHHGATVEVKFKLVKDASEVPEPMTLGLLGAGLLGLGYAARRRRQS